MAILLEESIHAWMVTNQTLREQITERGTAIIMPHPIGLLIGALFGLVAGALALRSGMDEAKRRAEHWDGAPRWLLARALADTKIARLRDDLKGQVADKVSDQSVQARDELENQVRERVEQDIASLSAISQL